MTAVLMLNHDSSWLAAPKDGAPTHQTVRAPCSVF